VVVEVVVVVVEGVDKVGVGGVSIGPPLTGQCPLRHSQLLMQKWLGSFHESSARFRQSARANDR
jgi:hypothetical protein